MNIRIINVPPELHRQFKTLVTAEGKNISGALRDMMQDYVNKNKKQLGKDTNLFMDESGKWIRQ